MFLFVFFIEDFEVWYGGGIVVDVVCFVVWEGEGFLFDDWVVD